MTWPGEALLIKLWETLAEKGVGGLLIPWQIKREAVAQIEARRIELVALADAERNADAIRSGRLKLTDSRYTLALTPPDTHEEKQSEPIPEGRSAVEVATSSIIGDALRREINVAKAITYAESELKDDAQKPTERDIEADWLHRWRDYAGSKYCGLVSLSRRRNTSKLLVNRLRKTALLLASQATVMYQTIKPSISINVYYSQSATGLNN